MNYQGVSMLQFLALLLLISTASYANVRECDQDMDDEERNECMAFERDQAVGQLMSKVTKICVERLQDMDAEENSNYPLLLDKCMANKLEEISKTVD